MSFSSSYLPNVTSAILGWALDKLTDFFVKEILLLLGANDVMKRLERTLLRVHALLKDVEISDREWEIWLEDLKSVAYEADDLLDEIAIFASKKKLNEVFQVETNQVRVSASGLPSSISSIPHKMDVLQKKIDGITKEMEHLSVRKLVGTMQFKTKATGSLMLEPHVFGREKEKNLMKNLLLSDDSSMENITVIPVVGMGGIGKTTVAQLVYNDVSVRNHFQLRMWVSVHREFDVRKLTKSIIESATHKVIDLMDLDPLQVTLERLLGNRRFLLVLDDVWNESYSDWDVLQAPLRVGARGSRIVVTTRSQIVSRIMNTSQVITLSNLSDKDCWSLFKRRAFGNTNADIHPNLVAIGTKIVKKCKGLPLAVKTLGSLLKSKRDETEWNIVLKTEIWDFSEEASDILLALRLSYQYLPAHLKQCFAYSAIFPKGYKFEKEKLVLLWIAEGFVQPKGERRMEDVGSEYFENLLCRSFFQDADDDVNGLPRYLMHDLIHDLAKFVSNDQYLRLEDDVDSKSRISKSSHHLSFFRQSVSANMFDALSQSPSLRTMLLLTEKKGLVRELSCNLFDRLECLRVLDLSNICITEVPSSIGKLKHLRYLDLSKTLIKTLPKNVKTLYSLQTLKLRDCIELLDLPKEMSNLINLRHLDLEGTLRMNSVPAGIGKLADLLTVTAFVVGTEYGCKIGELKYMINLRTLHILKLENVRNIEEATEAMLVDKKHLHKLKLQWSEAQDENVVQRILACLRPHKDIKELEIEFYGGASFPGWMGDPSYSALVKLSIDNCPGCKLLPPLGQLPALKSLHIANMPSLQNVDESFCGAEPVTGSPSLVRGFPSLEKLEFDNLAELRRWNVKEGNIPRLRQLVISSCLCLTTLPIIQFLRSLEHLEISHCEQFQELPNETVPMSLRSLTVDSCPILRRWYETEGNNSLQAIALNREVMIDGILYPK